MSGESAPPFRRLRFALPDGEMAGVGFGDPDRPVDILFLHATGFNALTYRTLLSPLASRFHVVAVDLRGHGRTSLPSRLFGYASWNRHRDDVIALLDAHFPATVTLAGHSMGATTALLVGGRRPDRVQGLALLDPVILRGGAASFAELPGAPLLLERTFPIAAKARRRRARFRDRAEAAAALTGRGIFAAFPAQVIEDYLTDGLVEAEDGVGLRLACAPRFESRTFAAQRHDPFRALARAPAPLVILRAERGSTTPPGVAAHIKALRPDAMLGVVEGATHALPMERPDRARAAIETAALRAAPSARYRDLV